MVVVTMVSIVVVVMVVAVARTCIFGHRNEAIWMFSRVL